MKPLNRFIKEAFDETNMKHVLSIPPYNFEWIETGDMDDIWNRKKTSSRSISVAKRMSPIGPLDVDVMLIQPNNWKMFIDICKFYNNLPFGEDATETAKYMISHPMFTKEMSSTDIRSTYKLDNQLDRFFYTTGTIKTHFEIANYYEALNGNDIEKLLNVLNFIKQQNMADIFFTHLSIDHVILNVKYYTDKEFKPEMKDWANLI